MTLVEQIPEDWQRGIVIVAHPDDIEYGAAAAVARWTGQGKDIRYVLVTSGEAGMAGVPPAEAAPLREAEEIAAAKALGVQQVEFLGHPDGRVQETLELRRDLAAAIRRHQPEMVVLFNFGDTWAPGYANSADHRAVGRAALDAISDAGNEWIFPELAEQAPWSARWAAVAGPGATHAVDVGEQLDQAFASLAEHRRYLEILSSDPLDAQVRAIVDRATGPLPGYPAAHAVGFELYYFAG